ncbi:MULTISPECIES: hypothetical protein [unclassified Oceanobacillus]|uniref:hypothetical protein n=1 Tax=unclassified Oceanobacillus TaxID=2630292 RepID=UPI00300E4EEE
MIPEEVELRIARYFFHNYLPDEVMREVEGRLLAECLWKDREELDDNQLVTWALAIIGKQLDGKSFK